MVIIRKPKYIVAITQIINYKIYKLCFEIFIAQETVLQLQEAFKLDVLHFEINL